MADLPNFRDYDNPDRKNPFGWDYYGPQKRERPTFKTKKEKEAFKKDFTAQWRRNRDAVTSFDPEKWRQFCELEKEAGGIEPIREAIRLTKGRPRKSCPWFSELWKAREASLKRRGSPTLSHAKLYADRFMRERGDKPAIYYTREDVQSFIDSIEGARETKKSNLRQIKAVFSIALNDGHIARSPCARIELPSARGEKRLQIIEPDSLQALLDHAREVDRPMSRLLAIAFFMGMRMSMIAPPPGKRERGEYLRRDMFDLGAKTIVIPAGIMKSGHSLELDDAPGCLWPWLDGLCPEDFGIAQNPFNARKVVLIEKLGITWPANFHRRSFGSYFAALKGRDYAARIMADKTESVFITHYEVSTFKATAEKYAQISPTR